MIVEKGKLKQQQQQQQQQQPQHQVHHRNLIVNCHAAASNNEDNDEENIVIDMADEDDDEEYDLQQQQQQQQHERLHIAQFCDNDNTQHNYGSISIYSAKNDLINNNISNGQQQQQQYQQRAMKSLTKCNNGAIHDEAIVRQTTGIVSGDDDDVDSLHVNGTHTETFEFRYNIGDLVWFDPNQLGYSIPGKLIDFYHQSHLTMLTIEGYAQPATIAAAATSSDPTQVYANPDAYNKLLLAADQDLQTYDLSDMQQIKSVKMRLPMSNEFGTSNLIDLEEMTLEAITWNLKLRFKQELVYTRCGQRILLSVNPYKQLASLYNLDQANKYDTLNTSGLSSFTATKPYGSSSSTQQSSSNSADNQLLRWLLLEYKSQDAKTTMHYKQQQQTARPEEPHIFQLANDALKDLLITGQDQCFVLLGDSGAGKTEASKLLIQYLATVNKSPSNLMTEQILESIQVLESFGNAKTILNDNSSRFGKLLEIRFDLSNGYIVDAKTSDLNLLDRSRIVGQAENERNYHVFYEMLAGLGHKEKEKYGLQSAEKYFYLNQGHCAELPAKEDGDDFRSLLASTQVLGFNNEEKDAIFRILASVLHLGNVYFHRKVLALRSGKLAQQNQQLQQHMQKVPVTTSGVEGVEVGSDTEVRWVSHLLQIQFDSVMRCLTVRTTDSPQVSAAGAERIISPLNIDQALDTRDAIARALYTCLFKWLIERINATINAADKNAPVDNSELSTGPMYLCRTGESLCEFQPDKLATDSRQSSMSKRGHYSPLVSGSTSTGNGGARLAQRHHNNQQLETATISILDAFGFEDLFQNNFEQLCINFSAEVMQYHTSRYLLRLEQAEYARERLKWEPLVVASSAALSNNQAHQVAAHAGSGSISSSYSSVSSGGHPLANAVVNLISKKPLGILPLLDDECNFPKATDQSFAEKCHHNHALNENYQRARLEASWQEFGVRHFGHPNRWVWYQVEGFIEKNRDALRPDIVELLAGSRLGVLSDILRKLATQRGQDGSLARQSGQRTLSRTYDGRYVSMKPRTGTVSARFQDSLMNNRVLESLGAGNAIATSNGQQQQQQVDHQPAACQPWFLVCLRPNRSKSSLAFDVAYVEEQARCLSLLELVRIQKFGYPIWIRYSMFFRCYKCLVPSGYLSDLKPQKVVSKSRNNKKSPTAKKATIRDACAAIINYQFKNNNKQMAQQQNEMIVGYQCGLTKMFLSERLHLKLEALRLHVHQSAIKILQRNVRMWQVRREFVVARSAAILVQAQWRGYLARREFWRQYSLLVNLQRRVREWLVVKRRVQLETKRRIQRQQQQRQLIELQSQQRQQADQFRYRQSPAAVSATAASGKSRGHYATSRPLGLDIPDELAQLYRLQREWTPVHNLSHLNSVNLSEFIEREQRRRQKYGDKSNSVPFVVPQDQKDDINEDELDENKQSAIGKLVQEIELSDRYTLHNLMLTYYTIESPQFGYSRLPITRPFIWPQLVRQRRRKLRRATPDRESYVYQSYAAAEQRAIVIYKLILRYIDSDLQDNDSVQLNHNVAEMQLSREVDERALQKVIKFKLIADYVIYLCIKDSLLRNEVYLQLLSQSWQNPKAKSNENVWKLMVNCLSCFAPRTKELTKFLLRHATDYCCKKYRHLAIWLLARWILTTNHSDQARCYPPSMLEYWANQHAIGRLALAASCYMDDHALNGPPAARMDDEQDREFSLEDMTATNHSNKTLVELESRTRAEELARLVLAARQVPDANQIGWSVEIQHEGALSEHSCRLRGDERLFDHFSQLELLPEFVQLMNEPLTVGLPVQQQSGGEVARTRRRSKQLSASEFSAQDHAALRRLSVAPSQRLSTEFAGGFSAANYHPNANQHQQHQQRRHYHCKRVSSELDLSTAARLSQTSRLNRRYLHDESRAGEFQPESQVAGMPQIGHKSRKSSAARRAAMSPCGSGPPLMLNEHRRSLSMQELQLASSALNDRYFGLPIEMQHAPDDHYAPAANQQVSKQVYSGHYASSSYISPASSEHHQSQGHQHYHQSPGYQVPSNLTTASSRMSGHRRRSRTPNRHSSSAYGSESRHSNLSYFNYNCNSAVEQPYGYSSHHKPPSATGSLRDARSQPQMRRSASSSSRQPGDQFRPDYAHSDYERVGGGGSSHYQSPGVFGRNPPGENDAHVANRWPSGQRPQNPLLERHRSQKQQMARERQLAAVARTKSKLGAANAAFASEEKPMQMIIDDNLRQCASNNNNNSHLKAVAAAAAATYGYLASSAMSDTSEAPSLASHVRGIKVPLHNADLDQYLDDLFNPMLDDAELDELSDARSLAASIRGYRATDDDELNCLQDADALSRLIRGTSPENGAAADADAGPLSPTFESLLQSLRNDASGSTQVATGSEATTAPRPNSGSPEDMYSRAKTICIGKWRWPPLPDDLAASGSSADPDGDETTGDGRESEPTTTEKSPSATKSADELMPPPPPPLSQDADLTSNQLGPSAVGSVGKLKISSEMKAKLEQLTNVTAPVKSDESPSVAVTESVGVKKLADQRRILLENQLTTGASRNSSHLSPEPSGGSKILAAKQQLAAAAGLALTALDGNGVSDAVSGSQSANLVNQVISSIGFANNQQRQQVDLARRSRVLRADELGPQSRAAISQRQAFYQISASSEQLTTREMDSGCAISSPVPGRVGSTELLSGSELQLPHVASQQRQLPLATQSSDDLGPQKVVQREDRLKATTLTRTVPMASNLNEIGRQSHERFYNGCNGGDSVLAKTLVTAESHLPLDQHQWITSPNQTLEHPRKVGPRRSAEKPRQAAAPGVGGRFVLGQQHRRLGLVSSETAFNPMQVRGTRRGDNNVDLGRARADNHHAKERHEKELQCFVYGNIDWQVKIRKEFFLPSETYEDPLVVQLIFAQLVADVFNPRQWTRLNNKERAAIKSLMKDNSIGYAPSLPQIGQLQPVKQQLVRMARSFGLYFTRSYQATNFALSAQTNGPLRASSAGSLTGGSGASSDDSSENSSAGDFFDGKSVKGNDQAIKLAHRLRNANNLGAEWIDMVAVHHSGLRLVVIEQQQQQQSQQQHAPNIFTMQSSSPFGYRVLDTLKYRDMTEVSQVGRCELLVSMRNGKKCWLLSSDQASQLGSLLKRFHTDYTDHLSRDHSVGSSEHGRNKTGATRATLGKSVPQSTKNISVQTTKNNKRHKLLSGQVNNNENAVLAPDDGHHDDHIEQRQAANRIAQLRSPSHSNYDLADGKRILSSDLATVNTSDSKNSNSKTRGKPSPPSSSATTTATSLSSSSTRADPSLGHVNNDEPASQLLAGESERRQQQQQQTLKEHEYEGEEAISGNKSAGNSSKKNLWQNSLSRMSNKFNIFGGGGGSQSRAKQHGANKNGTTKSAARRRSREDEESGKQLQQQVVLDAWIETKVDFDEDDDDEQLAVELTATTTSATNNNNNNYDCSKSAIAESSLGASNHLHEQVSAGGSLRSARTTRTCDDADTTAQQQQQRLAEADGKYSLLQFALHNFREAIDKYSLDSRATGRAGAQVAGDTSTLRGSLKLIETLRQSREPNRNHSSRGTKERGKSSAAKSLLLSGASTGTGAAGDGSSLANDWTWRELAEMVKFTTVPLRQSLLKLPSDELNKRAVDCFMAIMQYMGDTPANAKPHQLIPGGEVECVYLILINCHNYPELRDEIYCQLMKQTTNNRSAQQDSCLRGWRLFSIVAAYFDCSPAFKPYLLKYLETAAYDKRRAYCSVAALCLQNLRKTFKYNGRKNVPSIEEIAATSAGRNSKRQIYRLPGGTERVINTKSTTVVDDIIHEICSNMLDVTDPIEMLEFSLYCIADGDLYTMPLSRDEYILDITTELIKNHQQYFLIFCRSSWLYPLRLDSKLYIEVIYNQIAPDYLEGLLLVLPSAPQVRRNGKRVAATEVVTTSASGGGVKCQPALRLRSRLVNEVARIAALLHRASGTDYMPHKDEIKYLLPKPIIAAMKQQQRSISSAGSSSATASVGKGISTTGTGDCSAGSSSAASSGSSTCGSSSLARGHANQSGCGGGNSLLLLPDHHQSHTTTTTTDDTAYGSSTATSASAADTILATPQKWIELVQCNWREMSAFDTLDAKAQFLDIIRHWPLFGSSFFAIKFIQRDLIQPMDFILALNKLGIQMLDMTTHETVHKYTFNEVISTRKVRSEDGALYLDLKCGNLMKRTIIRIQTDQAHEISRLIRLYIDIDLLQQKQQQQQQQQPASISAHHHDTDVPM